jgi:outer membrane immunogenic protein
MRKFLLGFAVSFLALAPISTALAADYDPPPPPTDDLRPSSYDWSGLYVGVWAGVACIDGILTDNTAATSYVNAGCGGKGGVMGGYNYQFDSFVVGLEADWGMSDKIVNNQFGTADYTFALDTIATLRARAGLAFDDTLVFLTAGGAYARGDLDGIVSATPDHIGGDHWGFSLGGGVEHAVTDSFRLRLDYLYTALDTANYSTPCGVCNVDIEWDDEHEVRLGAIWALNLF